MNLDTTFRKLQRLLSTLPFTSFRNYLTPASAYKLVAARDHWRVLRALEHQSLLPAAYYFVHYAMKGTAKFLR